MDLKRSHLSCCSKPVWVPEDHSHPDQWSRSPMSCQAACRPHRTTRKWLEEAERGQKSVTPPTDGGELRVPVRRRLRAVFHSAHVDALDLLSSVFHRTEDTVTETPACLANTSTSEITSLAGRPAEQAPHDPGPRAEAHRPRLCSNTSSSLHNW